MKNMIIILLILLSVDLYAEKSISLIKEGNKNYEKSNFIEAELKYRNALEIENKIEAIYNLGVALYRQNKFEEASDKFYLTVSRTNNPELKFKALYNLGNSQFKIKDYTNSIKSYIAALRINPEDNDTRYNLELVRKLLKQQQHNQMVMQLPNNYVSDNQSEQNKDNSNTEQNKFDSKTGQNEELNKKVDNTNQNNSLPNENNKNSQAFPIEEVKISKEDAERLLNALSKNEKEIQKKIKKEKIDREKFEKNW